LRVPPKSGGVAYVALRWTRGAACAAPRRQRRFKLRARPRVFRFRDANQTARRETTIPDKTLQTDFLPNLISIRENIVQRKKWAADAQ
jgi:hypothetical protein